MTNRGGIFYDFYQLGYIKFNVKDLLRASLYVSTSEQIEEIITKVQNTFGVKEIKNKLYDNEAAYACIFIIFNY